MKKGFKYYAVDNYLDKYNLIIEVMGDFWHCHPLKYTKDTMKEIHKKKSSKKIKQSTRILRITMKLKYYTYGKMTFIIMLKFA